MQWLYKALSAEIKALAKAIAAGFAEVISNQKTLVAGQARIASDLARIEKLLTPPPMALPIVSWRLIGERKDEENDMWLLKYEADLPAIEDTPNNKDVVSQRLTTVVDGINFGEVQDLPKDATTVTFEVPKGKSVQLRRKLVDDDGNEGPHVDSETFVAKDTVSPDAPGAFGEIRLLGEREVPDEPPPPEEPEGTRAGRGRK